ncbi:NXPE family member 3-like [Mercenaria mercenaria]|uniref:NXPE family member 3-like n=1 Tax=Mercenaria mercenaria TaxID=6596 RepID=UPI00234F7C13|nr:NXPE family member 3-like [Mercenaria mercenaria]
MSWFCGKPSGRNILCKHWVRISRSWNNYTENMSKCEQELSMRNNTIIPTEVYIKTLSRSSANRLNTVKQPNITCTDYNTTRLWYKWKPSGYFYKGTWILRHCKGISDVDETCLSNRHIYFWGDSTLIQWYHYLLSTLTFECKILLNDRHAWRQTKVCYCHRYNITLTWMPHNIPISPFHVENLRHFFSNTIRETVSNAGVSEVMLIVHLYSHILMYSLKFFTFHIVEIKKCVENIFKRFTNVRVFIKLPHTFQRMDTENWMIKQPDFIGYIYTDIIHKVFKGLYKKVIVLDNRDATISIRNFELHPSARIVKAMVNQLFSYVCNRSSRPEVRAIR